MYSLHSFLQTRRYRVEDKSSYESNESLIELSARALRYYDEEADDYFEAEGDIDSARLGIPCAERFLAGDCDKTEQEFTLESEID